MVHKETFIGWKKGDVGKEFETYSNEIQEALVAELVSRTEPNDNRDMWIRGIIWGITALREWVPEFIPDMEEDFEDDSI